MPMITDFLPSEIELRVSLHPGIREMTLYTKGPLGWK